VNHNHFIIVIIIELGLAKAGIKVTHGEQNTPSTDVVFFFLIERTTHDGGGGEEEGTAAARSKRENEGEEKERTRKKTADLPSVE
jgi:hypothetical protein